MKCIKIYLAASANDNNDMTRTNREAVDTYTKRKRDNKNI